MSNKTNKSVNSENSVILSMDCFGLCPRNDEP